MGGRKEGRREEDVALPNHRQCEEEVQEQQLLQRRHDPNWLHACTLGGDVDGFAIFVLWTKIFVSRAPLFLACQFMRARALFRAVIHANMSAGIGEAEKYRKNEDFFISASRSGADYASGKAVKSDALHA